MDKYFSGGRMDYSLDYSVNIAQVLVYLCVLNTKTAVLSEVSVCF